LGGRRVAGVDVVAVATSSLCGFGVLESGTERVLGVFGASVDGTSVEVRDIVGARDTSGE
jgi:hypothetical protein